MPTCGIGGIKSSGLQNENLRPSEYRAVTDRPR